MRRFTLLLMVILLPLRAWAGDAMSMQMAMWEESGYAASAMPADCPMHTTAASLDEQSADAADEAPGPSCSSCDLCLPLAELFIAELDAAPSARHVMRPAAPMAALGVVPLLGVRPPIS